MGSYPFRFMGHRLNLFQMHSTDEILLFYQTEHRRRQENGRQDKLMVPTTPGRVCKLPSTPGRPNYKNSKAVKKNNGPVTNSGRGKGHTNTKQNNKKNSKFSSGTSENERISSHDNVRSSSSPERRSLLPKLEENRRPLTQQKEPAPDEERFFDSSDESTETAIFVDKALARSQLESQPQYATGPVSSNNARCEQDGINEFPQCQQSDVRQRQEYEQPLQQPAQHSDFPSRQPSKLNSPSLQLEGHEYHHAYVAEGIKFSS